MIGVRVDLRKAAAAAVTRVPSYRPERQQRSRLRPDERLPQRKRFPVLIDVDATISRNDRGASTIRKNTQSRNANRRRRSGDDDRDGDNPTEYASIPVPRY